MGNKKINRVVAVWWNMGKVRPQYTINFKQQAVDVIGTPPTIIEASGGALEAG